MLPHIQSVLIQECHAFGHTALSAMLRRLGYIFTCGFQFDEWNEVARHAKFNLDRWAFVKPAMVP